MDPPDWERVDAEMADLADRCPERRPPLYGVPVGVKDIFHVDGFETRAGAGVPAAALRSVLA